MVKIDMELPKSCDMCDFNSSGYPIEYCNLPKCVFDVTMYTKNRHPWCPLIECEENEK